MPQQEPTYPKPPFARQEQPWPAQPSGGQPTDKLVKFGEDTPLGRPGQPAEIAPLYVLLASHEASFTTGNVWGSTGGETGP